MNNLIIIKKLLNMNTLINFSFLLIILFVLLIIIFAVKRTYNYENYENYGACNSTLNQDYLVLKDTNTPETSHNVDMPLNTSFSCKNMCGPLSRCSITGEQCTSDVDCFGCIPSQSCKSNPIVIPVEAGLPLVEAFEGIKGLNESGKLTTNVVPQYSSLTIDIGTNAKIYNDNNNDNNNYKSTNVPKAQYGLNTWLKSFDAGLQIYKRKNNYEENIFPENFKYIPKYPLRETTTGLYKTDDVLASNDYF